VLARYLLWYALSSLCRGHANLLCIVPILLCATSEEVQHRIARPGARGVLEKKPTRAGGPAEGEIDRRLGVNSDRPTLPSDSQTVPPALLDTATPPTAMANKGMSKEEMKQEHPLQAIVLCDSWGEEARWGPLVRRSRTEEEEYDDVQVGGEQRPWVSLARSQLGDGWKDVEWEMA
jgi:hypothetical protein